MIICIGIGLDCRKILGAIWELGGTGLIGVEYYVFMVWHGKGWEIAYS